MDGFISVRQSATSEANKKVLDYHHHWCSRGGQRAIPQICWTGTAHLVGKVLPEAQQGIHHLRLYNKIPQGAEGKKVCIKNQLLKNLLIQTCLISTEVGRTVRWEAFTGPSCEKLQGHSGERRWWSGSGKNTVVLQPGIGCRVGWDWESPLCKGEKRQKKNWSRLFLFLFYLPCSRCTVLLFSLPKLFNNRSYNTSLKYLISGPGVDEAPEVGLFSIEDDANAHVFVHRAIDRERTPDFQVTPGQDMSSKA